MLAFLTVGFLIGMAHAFEADHLAAMGALAADRRKGGLLGLVARGASWGVGHTITLFVISGAVLILGTELTATREAQLEFAVGVMLVGLGLHVLWRLWRDRIHFHVHRHPDEAPHLHAHSHEAARVPHRQDPHHHAHGLGLEARPLFVGLMHGMAGSAGLLALAVGGTQNAATAMGYVLIFGLGSLAGMSFLSFVAYWPIKYAERSATILHRLLVAAAGCAAIGIGLSHLVEAAPAAWGAYHNA